MQTVGAYEAKTHLGQLLDAVACGETITITKHGVPVAMLVPSSGMVHPDRDTMIDAWLEERKGITLGDDLSIRDMIEEGRR
ncbi:MAG: type II toxin-antitoxin system prevent-host-death family antitoxin [Chloroflexota bacterium]|nr:type II toxin-antitoxin system prevent-host-death family antitoxin [Chloroflexota bacterium]